MRNKTTLSIITIVLLTSVLYLPTYTSINNETILKENNQFNKDDDSWLWRHDLGAVMWDYEIISCNKLEFIEKGIYWNVKIRGDLLDIPGKGWICIDHYTPRNDPIDIETGKVELSLGFFRGVVEKCSGGHIWIRCLGPYEQKVNRGFGVFSVKIVYL